LKILVVASKYPPEYSGAGFRIHSTYKRISKIESITWETITNSTEYIGNKNIIFDGVKVTRISSRLFFNWRNYESRILSKISCAFKTYTEVLNTIAYLIFKDYDLLHVIGMSSSTSAAIFFARIFKKPLILELVTANATPCQQFPCFPFYKFIDLDKQTVIVAISSALGKKCNRLGFSRNVWVRPNPVDETRFYYDKKNKISFRNEYTQFSEQDCLITSVAKFMPQKNQLFLLDVIMKLPERFKLLLAGPIVKSGIYQNRDIDYLNNIKSVISKNNLEDRVQVIVDYVDIEKYIKASDVYAMPNIEEGLGTPMLESLSCGTPVIANRQEEAFREWVEDGVNGYCVDLNVEYWSEYILKIEGFHEKNMQETSLRIRELASFKYIDGVYKKILTQLKNMSANEFLDIQHIVEN
jgi:glycosyltransferase involved in cell wall biosynthesis